MAEDDYGLGVIICYARCDACSYGAGECCYDPPKWHTWAEREDIDHARETGQADPSTSRCGCPCAVEPTAASDDSGQSA